LQLFCNQMATLFIIGLLDSAKELLVDPGPLNELVMLTLNTDPFPQRF
jgi:hypothetical protein